LRRNNSNWSNDSARKYVLPHLAGTVTLMRYVHFVINKNSVYDVLDECGMILLWNKNEEHL